MGTNPAGRLAVGTLGRGSIAAAVGTVQLLAFAMAYALGYPTLYAGFLLLSAAGLGVASGEGAFGVAMATLGSVLLVALGLPLLLFLARQSPSLVARKATDPAVHRALYIGLYAPFLAAGVSVLFGVPLAYLLARGVPGQSVVESLVDLPLVVPHSVAGLIVLFGFGSGGAVPSVSILGTLTGMVLALTFVSAPYTVNAAREAFESVDDRLCYAARIHGATPAQTFRRVIAPLAARGIVTGGVLAWARAVSEFGAVAVVAYNVSFFYPPAGERVVSQHAPVFVYNTYQLGGLDESGAVAALLLGVSAGIFLLVRWLTTDWGRGGA